MDEDLEAFIKRQKSKLAKERSEAVEVRMTNKKLWIFLF